MVDKLGNLESEVYGVLTVSIKWKGEGRMTTDIRIEGFLNAKRRWVFAN